MPRLPKKSDYVAQLRDDVVDGFKVRKERHVSLEEQKQVQEQLGALAEKLRPKEELKKHGDEVPDQEVQKEKEHAHIGDF